MRNEEDDDEWGCRTGNDDTRTQGQAAARHAVTATPLNKGEGRDDTGQLASETAERDGR